MPAQHEQHVKKGILRRTEGMFMIRGKLARAEYGITPETTTAFKETGNEREP